MKILTLIAGTLLYIGRSRDRSVENPPEFDQVSTSKSLTYEETLAHFTTSYEGTQRSVPLLDAKAGVAITLCLGIFVLLGKLLSVSRDRAGDGCFETNQIDVNIIWSLGVLVGCATVTGTVCLVSSFNTVKPNLPKHESDVTILFPACREDKSNLQITALLTRFSAGEERGFILKEYTKQISAMASVVRHKIVNLRIAISALFLQGLSTLAVVIHVAVTLGFGLLPDKSNAQDLGESSLRTHGQSNQVKGIQ